MWLESANPKPDDDIATRVKTKQLPELEAVYTYLNERSGKHLPFVSNDEAKRGDGRKYKWIVGNGWGGSWSGWCPDLAWVSALPTQGFATRMNISTEATPIRWEISPDNGGRPMRISRLPGSEDRR